MGFLKIGDRAAGAIKSGGTTRRAAKMVICDMDHPDIEAFINWKVIEEQKVASLVAGSKLHEARLNDIFAAIRPGTAAWTAPPTPPEESGPESRHQGRQEGHDPRHLHQPHPAIRGPGLRQHRIPDLRHRLGFRGLHHRLGPELEQLGPGHRRLPARGERGPAVGADPPHRRQGRQDHLGARAVGPDRPCRLGLRRPGHPVPRHRERLAHLPGRWADPGLEPLLGIHVPRRHRLQPGVDEPADLLQGRKIRRRRLHPRQRGSGPSRWKSA
jgi:hypothetical protein